MTISARDQQVIWHPFTQHHTATPHQAFVRGEGAFLFDQAGKRYLDLISSWWVNLHGHCHPEIVQALHTQAMTLEHAIFSEFTHEPAVTLAEKLLALLPSGLSKVFYSDNGSTAVEVSLKMAYQYWCNRGEPQRQRFIAFEKSYHGDTFGAMAVGKQAGFFTHFEKLLFAVDFFPYPETWIDDTAVLQKEQQVLQQLTDYLDRHGHEVAALIIEPMVQGVAGMRMCRAEFLRALEQLLHQHGVLTIYDEVMTGFGRTGDDFACLKAGTTPDIICLAKGLSGGFLPLAVTVCKQLIYEAFLGDTFQPALAHGHSYTANPLGCAAALASLDILTRPATRAQIAQIEAIHKEELAALQEHAAVKHLRYCGTIAAFDLDMAAMGYGSQASIQWRHDMMDKGLIIRPLGNVVYLLPPYCIAATDLRNAYQVIKECIYETC